MKNYSKIIAKILIFSFFSMAILPVIFSSDASAQATASANNGSTVTADANDNILVRTMCNALKLVTGNAGKAFAAFAIISVGIGFFTGKVSWGLMIGVAMGIAAMFGAPSIVAALSNGSAYDCSN